MSDVALGWTLAQTCPPGPVRLQGDGPVRAMTAPTTLAATPRQRLALLQSCFDAGIDMVPLSAHQQVPATSATIWPANLLTQLADLRDCGQISLTLTWTIPNAPQSSDLSWLRVRQRVLTNATAKGLMAKNLLAELAKSLSLRQSELRHGTGQCSLDLLVTRPAFAAAAAIISNRSEYLRAEGLPGASLLVTGLWPPYSFVKYAPPPGVPA